MSVISQHRDGSRFYDKPGYFYRILGQHLTKDNDGSTIHAIGNYSVTPAYFEWKPPAGTEAALTELGVAIEDAGNFAATGYGAGSALSTGLNANLILGSGASALTGPTTLVDQNIKTNFDWANYAVTESYLDFGSGTNVFHIHWEVSENTPIMLDGDRDEGLQFTLNDDFTFLVDHTFVIHGVIRYKNAPLEYS